VIRASRKAIRTGNRAGAEACAMAALWKKVTSVENNQRNCAVQRAMAREFA
jgi:hypothetical protein